MKFCIIVISILLGGLLYGLPATAETVLGGIGGRPISQPNQLDRQEFRYTLRPGDVQLDILELINNTPETVTVNIYAADSSISSDGSFAVEQQVESRDFFGAWVNLEQNQVTIPALSSVEVPFTVTLPTDTNLSAGEYIGGIMIENANLVTTANSGITIATRVGVRGYITIPGQLLEAVRIEDFQVEPLAHDHNVLDVRIAVHNDGNINQTVNLHTTTDMQSPWPRWLARQRVPSTTEATLEVLSGQTAVRHFTVRRPWLGRLSIQAYIVHHTSQGDETVVSPLRSYLYLPPWYVWVIISLYITALITLEVRQYRRRRLGPIV